MKQNKSGRIGPYTVSFNKLEKGPLKSDLEVYMGNKLIGSLKRTVQDGVPRFAGTVHVLGKPLDLDYTGRKSVVSRLVRDTIYSFIVEHQLIGETTCV